MPRVEGLFIAREESAPMESLESIEAVEGGLAGDRYQTGRGYYSPYDVCEVTLIEAEAIEDIAREFAIDLTDGRHRRNVVTRGVAVHELLGATFAVGEAVLRGTRPRPPCAHVERVAGEEGVARALKNKRGGICATVVEPGSIELGDELTVIEPDSRTMGRKIVDRLGF